MDMMRSGALKIRSVCMILLWHGMFPLAAAPAPHSASELLYSPDGRIIAVLDSTSREVLQIDAATRTILQKTGLTGQPAGLAWSPDSKSFFVSESGVSRISEIHAVDGKVLRSIDCGRYPAGLALSPRHGLLLVADWGLNELAVIDFASGTTRSHIATGCQPTAVAITADESLAVVTALLPSGPAQAPDHAAEITLVELATLKTAASIRLPLGSTVVRDAAVSNDGTYAYVSHLVGRYHLPTTQVDRGWVNTNAISIIDLAKRKLAGTVLLDDVMRGAADPWGVAIHPAEPLLYVSLSGTHELAVVRLDALTKLLAAGGVNLLNDLAALNRVGGIRRIAQPLVGPRGLAVSPDGRAVAMAGYFSGNVVVTDTQGGSPVSISLGPQPEDSPERLGEIAFHDASTCFQTWLSCATCHPDARADGLNWDLLNDGVGNPKNTRSMLWSDRTPPLMTLGVRSDMRAAVRAGFTHIEFGQPDEKRVEEIMAYFRSLEPVASPYRMKDGSLSDAARRGKTIFEDHKVGCATCHPAPLFTNLRSADVGTALPLDMGATKFDTPSLIELWRNPPYLHHGHVATLREVLASEKHGKTSHLDAGQLDDLIAYLMSL